MLQRFALCSHCPFVSDIALVPRPSRPEPHLATVVFHFLRKTSLHLKNFITSKPS